MFHVCRGWPVSGVILCLGMGGGSTVSAQDAPTEPARAPDELRKQKDPDYTPPKPDRRRDRRLDRDRRRHRSPRRFDLRPQFQRDEFGYRFGVPAFDEFRGESVERAYRQGLADGRNSERFEIRAERGLASYQEAMLKGHAAFAKAKYGLAARQFLLAATLNQGDPASRLCAAHAHTALHDYGPAARLLHRAFELQPRLVYLPMDIRGAYGNGEDFVSHRDALRRVATQEQDNADAWFLLGYYHFYTNNMGGAARALERAAKLAPDDPLIAELGALAGMSAGVGGSAPLGQRSPENKNRK